MRSIVWYRGRDLRVEDQPALASGEVIPVFILEPGDPRAAASGFRGGLLRQRLDALRRALEARGSGLVLLQGDPGTLLPACALRWGAGQVRTLRDIHPAWAPREAVLARSLAEAGVGFEVLEGATLAPPGSLRTGSGGAYRVFTPFARAFLREVPVPWPLEPPGVLAPLPAQAQGIPWPWEPGPLPEDPLLRMGRFLQEGLGGYAVRRDLMGEAGTSRLSADLASGALSVRRLWHGVRARMEACPGDQEGGRVFLNELLWREFAHHTLHAMPGLGAEPFRPQWRGFPWRVAPGDLEAWKEGRTGYAIVDAAARELLATGHVHNRARMIAATFLTKHLLVDWREGEAHYRRHLADYDPACNLMGWQWCAGCGVDAQPWFRIFNPLTQAKRFDPRGAYAERWAPQPPAQPVVDLALGRARFLETAKAFLG